MNYAQLLEGCSTARQREIVTVLRDHNGNGAEAARALQTTTSNIHHTITRIQAKSNQDYKAGFQLDKQTIQRDKDGNIERTWDKIKATDLKIVDLVEHLQDTFSEYKNWSRYIPAPPPTYLDSDTMTMYPMGDPHIGMLAHKETVGRDFNTEIAEENLIKTIHNLIQQAPPSHTAVLLNLGDFFHTDDSSNRTRRSGNLLDVDGIGWSKIYQTGLRIMIRCIEMCLEKHHTVYVRNVVGNHDEHTSMTLSIALSAFFHDNPRVHIDTSDSAFWYFKFGDCLFGSTHGDMAKPNDLPLIMAQDMASDWGKTVFRYWHTGHIHHDHVKDYVGCRWESHRTLAYQDAWHSASGYRSQQDMKAITYHKKYGEVSRITCNIKQLD